MAQAQQPQKAQAQDTARLPKILRIGVIQGQKIVEERLVRRRENVTVGQSAKNTFVVPASNVLPRSFTIFEVTPQGYALNFTEGMDGRIAFDQNVTPVTLAQLRGKAVKRGDLFHVLLNDRARGKIVMGDVTILFQFVAPPPVQPRPQLPPSVRGSITQDLDWMLVGVVGASFFTHIAVLIYLHTIDLPKKPDIEDIPDRFVQMIVPKKKEEKKVEKKVDPNEEARKKAEEEARKKRLAEENAKKKKDAADEAKKPQKTAEEIAREQAERKARLAAQAQQMGALKILGAKGEGGALADLLHNGDPGGDADKVFSQVGGVGVATADTGLRAKGAGGAGSTRGIAGLRASGPSDVDTGNRGAEREATLKGKIKDVSSGDVSVDGQLSADLVVNTIKARKQAVIDCYERALKRNPSLGGKVVLHFTISQIGKVTGADIEDDTLGDAEVNQCITSRVKTWRFPPTQGGEVQFSFPFVFQSSK